MSTTITFRLLGLLLALALPLAGRAQAPANDEPCGAIVLARNGNICSAPTVGTNVGATPTAVAGHANPTPGCGGGGPQPRDVWYVFQTAATGLASFGATLTVTGNPAGQLRLYAAPGCVGPLTLIGCAAAAASNTAAPRLVTGALQPGTTYFVAVNGYADGDQTGAFTICLTDGPGAPGCGAPFFIGAGSVNATVAQIGFNGAGSSGPYQAVLTGGGSTRTVAVAASPLLLTGLSPATTYQLMLTGVCPGGGATPSAGFSFTTPTAYCVAGLGGSCSANYITSFALLGTTLANTTQIPQCYDGLGGGAGPLQAYTYFAPTVRPWYTATLLAGSTYPTSVEADGSSSVSAWLDADRNGVFDPSEWTELARVTQNGQAAIGSLAVPANALPGPTGLRIRSRTFGSPNTAGAPCVVFFSGEVEDYTVTIALPTAARPAAEGVRLTAYPNPAADQLTIAYERPAGGAGAGLLRVCDALGREVHRQAVPAGRAGQVVLALRGWASGTYTYRIAWPDRNTATRKFSVHP